MKAYIKEIFIGLLVITTLIIGIVHFYRNIQERKKTDLIDLYSLVASGPEGLIKINRPQVVSSLILSREETKEFIHASIPDIYLSLIKNSPSSILSIHQQGIVFYTKADSKIVEQIQKNVLASYFPSYMPYEEERSGVVYHLYPDTDNRFFGYYHHNGILVAGYNLKLLEEVAAKQNCNTSHPCYPLNTNTEKFDQNAPMNLLLPTDKLDLHFQLNDSTTWRSRETWLTTDIFSNEGKICCYGNMEVPLPMDSLYLSLAADTLSRQFEKIFPALKMDSQIYQEEGTLYYTGCTTNPS